MKLKNLFILSVLALTLAACEDSGINESLATAPKDMSGKTMKIDGATIKFSSNSSATISDYIGTAKRATVSYKRTSEITAHLNFFYHSEDQDSMSERTYNLDLTFADPTQGLASGSYTYKLTIHKGTKYETSDSGSKNVKNKIFSVN
ncbi:MAG: hypothetical protein IJQ20_04035 [Paludibacteraceae bacterium]|nr:hypothetical protein [Paludibacteraceae bacterium]